jgi:glucosylceramidase
MKNQSAPSHAVVFRTAKGTTDRLTFKDPILFKPIRQIDANSPSITIDESKTFQVIEGFGGSFTDASAETYYRLPKKNQKEILTNYFDPEKGIGYTLAKTHINSCDFSSECYSYDDEAGDFHLKNFSIGRDKHRRIPFILEALKTAGPGLKLFVTPWSPPAWMKTNNEMVHGGKLKPECYSTWARYLVRFIQEYEKSGIPIWGLTVQNEPMAAQIWESCIYTAYEERDFIRDFLGPMLHGSGLSRVKLMGWDYNRGIMYQWAKVVYGDPEAAKFIWGMGYHWYSGDHFDNPRLVHETFPDKKLLFTEGCLFPFDWNKIDNWNWGEQYARSMIMDLNNWSVGWVDWNLLLDEKGGPNHVSNFCYAPIIADTRDGSLHYMNTFYYVGHFSKFIRPGAMRIVCTSNCDDLQCTAFLNPDGGIAVIVLNQTEADIDFQVFFEGHASDTTSMARSIMTILIGD